MTDAELPIPMTEPTTETAKPAMKWYIVHTYSGYEHKAKAALEERVRSLHKEEKIGKVLVPIERVQELGKGGARKVSSRKFFPGYIFVQMVLDDETWHVIKDTPKITGFVGHSTNPPEVPISEVEEIEQQMEEGALRPKPKVLFEAGEGQGPRFDFDFRARDSGRARFCAGREGLATTTMIRRTCASEARERRS